VHPNQITSWRSQLLEVAADVFGDEPKPDPATAVDLKSLHAKIVELTLANDFFCLESSGRQDYCRTQNDG